MMVAPPLGNKKKQKKDKMKKKTFVKKCKEKS